MCRVSWLQYQRDVIVETSSERVNDRIQALVRMVSRRNFDKSVFPFPVVENIGVLPESWQILWSSRVAGLPDAWSVCQDI